VRNCMRGQWFAVGMRGCKRRVLTGVSRLAGCGKVGCVQGTVGLSWAGSDPVRIRGVGVLGALAWQTGPLAN